MAIKYFCDACDRESKRLFDIDYMAHLKRGIQNYVINDMSEHKALYPCNFKIEKFHVCIECYNRIMSKVVDDFYAICNEWRDKRDHTEV